MIAEITEISIITDKPIPHEYTPKLRGFFGNYYRNRFEFHHHIGKCLLYKHPLIQYKIIGGAAVLTGINEGAFLLRVIDRFEKLSLGNSCFRVIRQNETTRKVDVGIKDNTTYGFLSPWLALNESNYRTYQKISDFPDKVTSLLENILIGNLLSFSKSIGYSVDGTIKVSFAMDGAELIQGKNDTTMVAFNGSFTSNFSLPDLWGIGKRSSIGYGVVKKEM